LTVLNIAGRGEPIALDRCAEIAEAKLLRVPGEWMMRQLSRLLWRAGISEMPPEAIPYLSGNPIMNTDRLREFLGPYYEDVIHHTVADAFACSFASRRHLETVGSTAHTVDHV
ncbi:MAG: hypothetical protein ACHP8A_15815, partial [Terriglobales bacterium]